MGVLAYVFHMQPSEIDALELDDFLRWLDQVRRIKAQVERPR